MKRVLIILALLVVPVMAQAKPGFTLEPQVGLSYTTDWRLAAGLKLAHAGQYSASALFTREEYGLSITRRLTDKLPVKSLAIGLYGVNFFGDFRVGAIATIDL